MNLIVDIGNTRTKYAVFDEGDWVECGLGLPEVYDLATTYRKSGKEVNLILSSTGAISAEVREPGICVYAIGINAEPCPINCNFALWPLPIIH